MAIHSVNLHAFLQPYPLGHTLVSNLPDNGRNMGNAYHAQQPVGENGEQEVGHGAGRGNGNTLAGRLGGKGLVS